MQSLSGATQAVILIAVHLPVVRTASVSFINLHSLLPSFRFITPRSQLNICFNAWHTLLYSLSRLKCAHIISQAIPTILTGFHFTTLSHSFISGLFNPPAVSFITLAIAGPLLRYDASLAQTQAYNFVMPRCASALSVHHSFQSFYCTASRSRSQDNSIRTSFHCLLKASKCSNR